MTATVNIFRPVEGAILDLASLRSVADAHESVLRVFLHSIHPNGPGMVLYGLEIEGGHSAEGPPGTVRPDAKATVVRVSPGAAVLTGRNGQHYLVTIEEPLEAPWPNRAGPAVKGSLVLMPEAAVDAVDSTIAVAREEIRLVLGFVKPGPMQAFLLPLASAFGNGRDWITDINRVWRPDHPAIEAMLKRFESLERMVWLAEPEGSVWDRQVLGRNWVRYQTMACAALQAARMVLSAQPTNTFDRVRLLNALFEQLNISVERAATELLQPFAGGEEVGPYAAVGARALQNG